MGARGGAHVAKRPSTHPSIPRINSRIGAIFQQKQMATMLHVTHLLRHQTERMSQLASETGQQRKKSFMKTTGESVWLPTPPPFPLRQRFGYSPRSSTPQPAVRFLCKGWGILSCTHFASGAIPPAPNQCDRDRRRAVPPSHGAAPTRGALGIWSSGVRPPPKPNGSSATQLRPVWLTIQIPP